MNPATTQSSGGAVSMQRLPVIDWLASISFISFFEEIFSDRTNLSNHQATSWEHFLVFHDSIALPQQHKDRAHDTAQFKLALPHFLSFLFPSCLDWITDQARYFFRRSCVAWSRHSAPAFNQRDESPSLLHSFTPSNISLPKVHPTLK